MNVSRNLGVFVLAAGLAACGSQPAEPPAGADAGAPAPGGKPRVFFVEPQDGATVKSPVHLRFGIENFELAAVPQGTVEATRPNLGHHHVGVDIDCLPAGTEIVKAAPWVHHGGAQTEMDMMLTPGPHKLTLQLGDDLHRAIAGLCQTITVNVVE